MIKIKFQKMLSTVFRSFTPILSVVVLVLFNSTTEAKPAFTATQYHEAQIIGGNKTENATRFPFYVQLLVRCKGQPQICVKCGGTILGPLQILTAAHCLTAYDFESDQNVWRDPKYLQVVSGSHTDSFVDETYTTQHLKVDHYYHLVGFDHNVAAGKDLALLILTEKISFDEYRMPLTPCEGDWGENKYDYMVWAVGVGLVNDSGKRPDKLMVVQLNEIPESVCRNLYWRFSSNHPPQGSEICHDDLAKNTDTCEGDDGGPLFLVNPDTTSAVCLYGVVSFGVAGKGCGHPEIPTVAARVSSYIDMFNLKEDENSSFTRRVDRKGVLRDEIEVIYERDHKNEERRVSVASKTSKMFTTYLIGIVLNLIIFF